MSNQELMPSPIDAFQEGTPMQKLLGRTLEELGGLDFVVEWAENNPDGFMRLMLAVNPSPQTHGGGGVQGPVINLNLPQGLGPGPLDITPDGGS